MRPCIDRNDSHIPFLEPPHSHDPTSVSIIAALPPCVMEQMPESLQNGLWELQQSAAVAYASYCRLQDLLEERFERLMPSSDSDAPTFSESAFFNYTNHIRAEKDYLVSDAFPDWRHKASNISSALRPYQDCSIKSSRFSGPQTVAEWQNSLQSIVSSWLDEARRIPIPDFDDTVQEYLECRKQALSNNSEESTPSETPMREDEPHFIAVKHPNFDIATKDFVTITSNQIGTKTKGTRQDSGIGMDC